MKLAMRRFKKKERNFNQKYKLRIIKESNHLSNLKGKYVFLLSSTKLCALLKFLSKNVCVAESLLIINEEFFRDVSPRFMIPRKRHKKLLAQSEVRVTEQFKLKCQKYLKKSKWVTKKYPWLAEESKISNSSEVIPTAPVTEQEENRKISPIKILSCKICNQKFLQKQQLEEHLSKEHFSDEDDSFDSEDELFNDEELELMMNKDKLASNPNFKTIKIKPEPVTPIKPAIVKNFKCLQCSAVCKTDESLLVHIEKYHPSSSSSSVTNRKRSVSSTSSSISKQSSIESGDVKPKIKYQRFDSKNKTEFSCKICSSTFMERNLLNRHIVAAHLSKVFKCFQCNVPFNKKLHLVRHLKTAHLKYKDEEGYISTLRDLESVAYFQCCFCRYSSKDKSKVEVHLMNEHYEDFEKGETQEDSISSSPDSLEELLLPETRALKNEVELSEEDLLTELVPKQEINIKQEQQNEDQNNTNNNKKRKGPNDPSFKYRCARCLRRFSRSNWLKKHPCIGADTTTASQTEPAVKKPRPSNEVNGFFRCRARSCSQVFTDRSLYTYHCRTAH